MLRENTLLAQSSNLGLVTSYMHDWLRQRKDILAGECLPSPEPRRNIAGERQNIQRYFTWMQGQFPEYMQALEKITCKTQSARPERGSAGVHEIGRRLLKPMNDGCRNSIVIPARNEGKVIYHSLSEIAKQVNDQGAPLDPAMYEVTVLINVSNQEEHDNTYDEIMRFKHDYPHMQVNAVEVKINKPWANIGFVRKLANDLTLLRAIKRGGTLRHCIWIWKMLTCLKLTLAK